MHRFSKAWEQCHEVFANNDEPLSWSGHLSIQILDSQHSSPAYEYLGLKTCWHQKGIWFLLVQCSFYYKNFSCPSPQGAVTSSQICSEAGVYTAHWTSRVEHTHPALTVRTGNMKQKPRRTSNAWAYWTRLSRTGLEESLGRYLQNVLFPGGTHRRLPVVKVSGSFRYTRWALTPYNQTPVRGGLAVPDRWPHFPLSHLPWALQVSVKL